MNIKARLTSLIPVLACLATANSLCAEASAAPVALTSVRVWSVGPVTRIAIQLTGDVTFKRDQILQPPRLFLDLHGCAIKLEPGYSRVMNVDDPLVERIRIALNQSTVARVVFDLKQQVDFEISQLANPYRLVIELRAKGSGSRPSPSDSGRIITENIDKTQPPSSSQPPASDPAPQPVREPARTAIAARKPVNPPPPVSVAARTAEPEVRPAPVETANTNPQPNELTPPPVRVSTPPVQAAPSNESARPFELSAAPKPADLGRGGRTSLTRALGLKLNRVVIDPGHGGNDHGTTGPGGVVEKELVLDLAKRLGALIVQRLGAEVVFTRDSDVYIPLEERTAIANRHRADLFLSIHVNSSPLRAVSGPEVFYLNFTDSKADLEVAARENAGHGKSIFELSELLQKIALKDKIDESREFARRVQRSLYGLNSPSATARNRGVKKAPFVVLIGASMPSILAEVGFVTNAREEALLKRSEHRDRLAEALYQGVADYASTLSKVTVAREKSPAAGTP